MTRSVRARVGGADICLVLGECVVLGRSPEDGAGNEGLVAVPSAALSRRHLSMARRDGDVWVRDLGSHNGTTLRGDLLRGETAVGAGLELRLGGEVTLAVRPAADLPGVLALGIAGARYLAALGPAVLGIGRWRLECVPAGAVGDWIELVTDDAPPAFARGIRMVARVSLVAGDTFATAQGGAGSEAVIRFEG